MVNDLLGDISVDQVPVAGATGCLLNFIRSLEACKNDEDIQLLFTDANGPALEQLISSSDWDPVEVITVENRTILINMLIYEDAVMRRGRKMKVMCERLLFMNFGKYLNENHCRLLFFGLETKVTTNKLKSSFIWKESADIAEENAKQRFLEFVDFASETYLKKILKFSTGFEDINNLRGNEITIDFLKDEVFLKASACLRIIFLPLGYRIRTCLSIFYNKHWNFNAKDMLIFKVGLSPFKKNFFHLLKWQPFKSDEKCFLFHLESFFRSQDF